MTPNAADLLRVAGALLFVSSAVACGQGGSGANDAPRDVHAENPPAVSSGAPPKAARSAPQAAPASSAPPVATSAASVVAPPSPTPPEIVVPASVKRASGRRPFLLLLHGFAGSGAVIAKHVGLPVLAESKGFSYAAPDGALDRSKRRHWNAGPSCCDFDRLGTDHVSALRTVIDAAKAHPAVDPARIYVAGFSNGGFMAERLACDVPGIAGVLDVAGSAPGDVASCKAPPIGTVIHVHGEKDPTVRVEGGRVLGRTDVAAHPAAAEAVAAWAKRAGCGTAVASGTLDLEGSIADAETTRSRYQGCPGHFELLTVKDGGHDIAGSPAGLATIVTILFGEGS